MTRPLVGISLQADARFLALNRTLIEDEAEIFEITPETLWDPGCRENPMHAVLADIVGRSGRPAIGHGILYSLGAAVPPPRRGAWLDALRRDREVFGFEWFSEHLGFADHGAQHVALPLPLPCTLEAVEAVARNLEPLRQVHDVLAFENNVAYFALGDPRNETRLFRDICAATGCRMVLDLHNAYTTCENFDLDLTTWLADLPLASVLEIHLSGGSMTDAEWFDTPRPLRLDSHDDRVPERVWDAFAALLPQCANLRAVIVEWMPDDMDEAAAAAFSADFCRARELLC